MVRMDERALRRARSPLAAARIAFSMLGSSRAGGPSVRAVKRDDGEDKTFAAVAARLARVAETAHHPPLSTRKTKLPHRRTMRTTRGRS